MGRRPKARGRNVHGIVLLNKSPGLTSNDALQQVKRLFNANRAGHTGSLDKPASGMLPICLGEATKLSAFLLDADKVYLTTCRLGITTTTGDAAGDILEQKPLPELDKSLIHQALASFQGEIEQVPPMYSAIKQDGKPLYQLAYQGIEVERPARRVCIHQLELLNHQKDVIELRVHCSKGTYIRSLAMDIGHKLGCGAHVCHLHRETVAGFAGESMRSMEDLQHVAEQGLEQLDQCLLPMDLAVEHLPRVELESSSADYVCQGQAVTVPKAPTEGMLRLYDNTARFLGIGRVLKDGRVAPKRLMNYPP